MGVTMATAAKNTMNSLAEASSSTGTLLVGSSAPSAESMA